MALPWSIYPWPSATSPALSSLTSETWSNCSSHTLCFNSSISLVALLTPFALKYRFFFRPFLFLVFLQVSFHLRTSTVVYDATSKPVFLTNDPSLIFLTISSWHPGISPWMSLTVLNLINWKPQAPFLLQNQLLFLGSVSFQGVTFHPHSNLGVLLTPSPNCSGLRYVYSAISHIHLLLSCHHSSWGSHF